MFDFLRVDGRFTHGGLCAPGTRPALSHTNSSAGRNFPNSAPLRVAVVALFVLAVATAAAQETVSVRVAAGTVCPAAWTAATVTNPIPERWYLSIPQAIRNDAFFVGGAETEVEVSSGFVSSGIGSGNRRGRAQKRTGRHRDAPLLHAHGSLIRVS